MTIWDDMRSHLADLDRQGLLRRLSEIDSPSGPRALVDGREVVCLCGNDYLGLANDPAVKAAAIAAIERWGVGAGASRLIYATTPLHRQLERRLAQFKGVEAALVTPTGWMANHVAVGAMAGEGDLVLADKLSHASLLDAARASGAILRTYRHGDPERLASLLDRLRSRYRRCLIVTDSVFSMDGDVAPLAELAAVKKRYDAQLLVDEAHATGVLGELGRGAAEAAGVEAHIDVTVGTLSKAIGALGGFVAGPAVLIDTIVNAGRAFIYTTAIPAALCAGALAALDIIRDQPQRRRRLAELADGLRAALRAAGLDTGASTTQIIPILVGPADRALDVSQKLLEAGFLVPAIRPPTVAPNTSRLRVSLRADHDKSDLAALAATVAPLLRR